MNNPYRILGLEKNQNADKQEIIKAQISAMKERNYTLPEIATATRQLLDPAKRLASDFMFPSKVKSKRIQKIVFDYEPGNLDIDTINLNAFDSLPL